MPPLLHGCEKLTKQNEKITEARKMKFLMSKKGCALYDYKKRG
jgi:hypothetical protein